jgi:hypothetical protein
MHQAAVINLMVTLVALVAMAGGHAIQSSRTIMLAMAMVRHQEPTGKTGPRVTVAEIYPIAWESRGEYLNASVDATTAAANSPVQAGDRFEIYSNGLDVGWFDVNRIATKPYGLSSKVVGLGGWSLPRRLYPYRLDRATNINYLFRSIYDWGNNTTKNSVQPFLALSTMRKSASSTQFSPAQMKRDIYPVVLENMRRIVKQVDSSLSISDLHVRTFKAYDLDDNRVPEVIVTYDLPLSRSLTVIATVEASAFIERYRSIDKDISWQPLDVVDVDGDGYKELVMLGRGNGTISFRVLRGTGGKLKKVFEGASFRVSRN